jgi:hypothetical protein
MFADAAASAAALAAGGGFFYARASAREARDAMAAAQRAIDVAVLSRQSAERARLRNRVERVGALVHEIYFSSHVAPGVDQLSERTRGQCDVLNQAVIGLKGALPKSTEVYLARSPSELRERASAARVEIDGVLRRLAAKQPNNQGRRAFRYARRVPWHR